jgi:hypothetical protein
MYGVSRQRFVPKRIAHNQAALSDVITIGSISAP